MGRRNEEMNRLIQDVFDYILEHKSVRLGDVCTELQSDIKRTSAALVALKDQGKIHHVGRPKTSTARWVLPGHEGVEQAVPAPAAEPSPPPAKATLAPAVVEPVVAAAAVEPVSRVGSAVEVKSVDGSSVEVSVLALATTFRRNLPAFPGDVAMAIRWDLDRCLEAINHPVKAFWSEPQARV